MNPPDETKREMVRQWVDRAQDDLGLAEHLLKEGLYFNAIGYNSKQAAEKFLKAFLAAHQKPFPKTHDLEFLLEIIETLNIGLAESLSEVSKLDDYGADIRYPSDMRTLTFDKAKEAVAIAVLVRDNILPHLKNAL